jgi:hypothetical protein
MWNNEANWTVLFICWSLKMIDGMKRGCKPGRLTGVRLENTLSRMITLVIVRLGRSMKI